MAVSRSLLEQRSFSHELGYPSVMNDNPRPLWSYSVHPQTGRKLGGEPRIASYLADRVGLGGTFTMRNLREALSTDDSDTNTDEHLNRRMRTLRAKGWILRSSQDEGSLRPGEYRVEKIGWKPEDGRFVANGLALSQRVRASVLERDGYRCRLCGRAGGEQWPDGDIVTLTIGHIVPQARGGAHDASNLRTECSRCNEPKREAGAARDTFDDVRGEVRALSKRDKQRLLAWLESGERLRDHVDEIFDRVRVMGTQDTSAVEEQLRHALRSMKDIGES